MSGQIVGEIIAASPTLQKRGVSQRGFCALIAIAEKCHPQTRRGSVRWDHIRDGLYGASKRTAQRAVQDLLTAGVLEVVKPGFGNQHGRTCAPIYQIAPLVDNDTWVAQSNTEDDDTQVSRSNKVDDDKSKADDDKSGSGSRHLGVVLDGPIDGAIDVPTDGGAAWLDDEPRCQQHRNTLHPPPCHRCKRVREQREAEQQARQPTAYERKTAHNAAVYDHLADEPHQRELEA